MHYHCEVNDPSLLDNKIVPIFRKLRSVKRGVEFTCLIFQQQFGAWFTLWEMGDKIHVTRRIRKDDDFGTHTVVMGKN